MRTRTRLASALAFSLGLLAGPGCEGLRGQRTGPAPTTGGAGAGPRVGEALRCCGPRAGGGGGGPLEDLPCCGPRVGGGGGALVVWAGLVQPLLFRGANVAVSYLGRDVTVTYSHGVRLRLDRAAWLLSETDREAGLGVYSPWSTGLGVGLRFGSRNDVRLEAKAHRYIVTDAAARRVAYTSFSVGPAVYRRGRLGRAVLVEGSLRYWPNVASTLPGGGVLLEGADGRQFRHEAYAYGLIANVSVGFAVRGRDVR